jgi:hypothetical protein
LKQGASPAHRWTAASPEWVGIYRSRVRLSMTFPWSHIRPYASLIQAHGLSRSVVNDLPVVAHPAIREPHSGARTHTRELAAKWP